MRMMTEIIERESTNKLKKEIQELADKSWK